VVLTLSPPPIGVIIKPDAVQAGNADKIIDMAEHNGFYVNRRRDAVLSKQEVKTANL